MVIFYTLQAIGFVLWCVFYAFDSYNRFMPRFDKAMICMSGGYNLVVMSFLFGWPVVSTVWAVKFFDSWWTILWVAIMYFGLAKMIVNFQFRRAYRHLITIYAEHMAKTGKEMSPEELHDLVIGVMLKRY